MDMAHNNASEGLDRLQPSDCATMDEVRREIDRLDGELVRLLVRSQRFIEAAARIKGRREAVRDEARIDDVLNHIRGEARRYGLSLAIAEPVWRALIEASIDHELAAFDRRHIKS